MQLKIYYTDKIDGLFEELVDPPRDSTAVLLFAMSTASAATVGPSIISTAAIGIPTTTIRRKILTGENIDEFDKFPAIRQYFPYQNFPFS